MSGEVVVSVVGTAGTLIGVALGSLLSNRAQRLAGDRQASDQARSERRTVYANFLIACREWWAVSMATVVQLVQGSAVSRQVHADGGAVAARVLALRSELLLVADSAATIAKAGVLVRAIARLAEARAEYPAGSIPEDLIVACRIAEADFVAIARDELGAGTLPDVAKILPTEPTLGLDAEGTGAADGR